MIVYNLNKTFLLKNKSLFFKIFDELVNALLFPSKEYHNKYYDYFFRNNFKKRKKKIIK